jgi:hypothetical protein
MPTRARVPESLQAADRTLGSSRTPTKEDVVPEFSRVVTFEADEAAINDMVQEINSAEGPPEGVNATRITLLADRAAGRIVVAVRFPSEEDLQKGAAVFEAMSPPSDSGVRRVSVDVYEVVLERDAP